METMVSAIASPWVFVVGWGLLLALAGVVGKYLPRDYRARLRPRLLTLLIVWAFLGMHFTLLVVAAVRSTWHFSVAAPLAVAGGVLMVTAGAALAGAALYAYRSVKRLNGLATDRLVTDGIYRWSRNPQIIAWTLVLGGVGLIRGSGMVLLLTLFWWLAMRVYLPVEEELLARLFGDAYQDYRRRTPRFVGRPALDHDGQPAFRP